MIGAVFLRSSSAFSISLPRHPEASHKNYYSCNDTQGRDDTPKKDVEEYAKYGQGQAGFLEVSTHHLDYALAR